MDLQYTMIIEPAEDDRGTYYCAYFPDIPGCTTMGVTLEELRANAIEAISGHLDALKELGKPVPLSTSSAEVVTIKAS